MFKSKKKENQWNFSTFWCAKKNDALESDIKKLTIIKKKVWIPWNDKNYQDMFEPEECSTYAQLDPPMWSLKFPNPRYSSSSPLHTPWYEDQNKA